MENAEKPISRSQNALVVSGSEKGAEFFIQLSDQLFSRIVYTSCAAEAIRIFSDTPFDVVIINTPLSDERGDALAIRFAKNSCAGVLMLIREEDGNRIEAAEEAGVLILTKPAGKASILSAVKLAAAVGRRLFAAQSKARTLESKMDEIKLVNRAKWLLIGKLGMSEEDAHRYIEKLAMNTRQSRREVAEGIIKTYEN